MDCSASRAGDGEPAQGAGRGARLGGSLFLLLGTLTALDSLSIDMYLPAFPTIGRAFGTTSGMLDYSLAVFLVGFGLGQLAWGPVSDRFGRRWPLIVGTACFVLTSLACGFAPSIGWLIGGRFLMGFAGASGVVVARAVVRDLFSGAEAAGAFSMLMVVSLMGPIVGPLAGGMLLTFFSWPAIFVTLAAFGVACLFGSVFVLPETLPKERRIRNSGAGAVRSGLRILFDRRFFGYGVGCGVLFLGIIAYVSSSPHVFVEIFGVSERDYSLLFAANSCGLYLGAQLNRRLLPRFGLYRILRYATVFQIAVGLAMTALALTGAGGVTAFYPVSFLFIASLGLLGPNLMAAAMAPFGEEAGTASAMLGLLQYGMGAVGGALVGVLFDHTARPMAGVILACAVVLAALVRLAGRNAPARRAGE